MKYISTFSGIEAASVAWEPLGWEPMAFSEIDEFPSAVLAHRYPSVPNLGDITKVDWKEFISEHGKPDVVVGGSPCQSFSVAGGRESLAGESRLMFEYIRALAEIRPKWFLWENVPGVLNTRDNAFAQLLGEVQDIGYLSLAWRVLDAQFFGVAQRRRRVFLVGHLGSGGGAAAVLFESESVRGNTQTSKQKREELARAAGRGSAAGGGEGSLNGLDVQSKRIFGEDGIAPTLNSGDREGGGIQPSVLQSACFKYHQGAGAGNIGYEDEQSPTLTADYHQPAVALQMGHTSGNGSGINVDDVSYTVSTSSDQAVAFANVCAKQESYVLASGHSHAEIGISMSPTLTAHAKQDPPILIDRAAFNQGENARYMPHIESSDLMDTLVSRGPHGLAYEDTAGSMAVTIHDGTKWIVRRLTPTECERLQGFPDGWTDVPYRGKEHAPDTPRYKAIGNSMATPVMRWIGERIKLVDDLIRARNEL